MIPVPDSIGAAVVAICSIFSRCHLVTWIVSSWLAAVVALNTRGPPRLSALALFMGVQAVSFNNLATIVWFEETLARFFGFTLFKLSLHFSYVVLVEDVNLDREDGTWDWLGAWNVMSNPRRIHGLLPRVEEHGEGARLEGERVGKPNGEDAAVADVTKPHVEHVETVDTAAAAAFDDSDYDSVEEYEKAMEYKDQCYYQERALRHTRRWLRRKYYSLTPRGRFLVRRLAYLVVVLMPTYYAVLRAFGLAANILSASDFAPDRQRLWTRLLSASARDWAHRSYLLVIYLTYPSTAMSMLHNAVALVAVGAGLSGPDDWPLLFGSILKATSLRRYWGRVWHRIFSEPALMWTKWAAARVVGLRRGSLAYGLFVPATIFALSGVMHGAVEARFGWCGTWIDFALPLLNYSGIVAEQIFQFAAAKVLGRGFSARHPYLCTAVGYFWVYMFFMEVLPTIEMTRARCYMDNYPNNIWGTPDQLPVEL